MKALLPIAILLLGVPAPAQTPGGESVAHFQRIGDHGNEFFGFSVANAGDVNGDGIDDLIVGSLDNHYHQPGPGEINIYSGLTGTLLRTTSGPSIESQFGGDVAGVGDVNLDGFDDYLVGATTDDTAGPWAGSATLYSGFDGSALAYFTGNSFDEYGYSVAGVGDVDADGHPDFTVSSHAGVGGTLYLYSGSTYNLLHTWTGAVGEGIGSSVAAMGDYDSDGFADFAIGSRFANSPMGANSGRIQFISGWGKNTTLTLYGDSGSQLGASMDTLPDLDLDGHVDLLVGAPRAEVNGLPEAGSAAVVTFDGRWLWEGFGENVGDWFGASVASVGFTTPDFYPDWVVGAPHSDIGDSNAGAVYMYSGNLGNRICRWASDDNHAYFGRDVCGLGNAIPGGFVASAPFADDGFIQAKGRIYAYDFEPFLDMNRDEVSLSAGGSFTLSLHFPLSRANHDYAVLMSHSGPGPFNHGVKIPLTYDDLVQSTWNGNYRFGVPTNMHGVLNSLGDAIAMLDVPAGSPAALANKTLWVAAVAIALPGQPPVDSSISIPVQLLP